jgi:Protein of unknown function (DUF3987)
MNSDNRLKTVSGLSSIWDGAPICRVRSGDGATNLIGRRVAMHLMVQPDVASILLGDRLLADQGFLSRMLVVSPEGTIGTRMWRDEQSQTEAELKRYHARLLSIFEAEMPLAPGKSNELEPRSLPLSQKAQQLFVQFHDHVEREMREGGSLEPIRGLANKLPEHAARLGAVLATVNDLQTCEVSGQELEAGITLAKFYAGEAIRLLSDEPRSSTGGEASPLASKSVGRAGGFPAGHLSKGTERNQGEFHCREDGEDLGRAPLAHESPRRRHGARTISSRSLAYREAEGCVIASQDSRWKTSARLKLRKSLKLKC